MNNANTEDLQLEAQERLTLDSLPDFVDGVVDVMGVPTQAKLYKSLYIYPNRNAPTPSTSWNVGHLESGKSIIVFTEVSRGINEQQAKRLAWWLSPLEWRRVDGRFDANTHATVETLVEAYSDRDWIEVEKIVNSIDNRRLIPYTPSTETVAVTDPGKQEEIRMSDTATLEMPVTAPVANGVHAEAPKKRGRKQRDPNSKAAQTRPGILMKPIAGFCSKDADTLSSEFGEKSSLVYAAGVLVLSQLPIEQQVEAFKQAKIKNVEYTRAEKAKQGNV